MTVLEQMGAGARLASRKLGIAGTNLKNDALYAIADGLMEEKELWLEANKKDLAEAEKNGMRAAMVDRLTLNEERIAGIVNSVRQVAALPDPIGRVDKMEKRPNGMIIGRRSVPLGVIAMIFEARPNVAVDSAVLCLKSGNACILRGGKEAIHSNLAAADIMRRAIVKAGLPEDCISIIEDTSHETANELMHLNGYVDVLIPRGGAGLIRAVARESSVPVIRTGEGVCHIYVDQDADIKMAADIMYNGKCSRPSVCNAVECVLIHEAAAEEFLGAAVPLLQKDHVEFRCDEKSLQIMEKLYPACGEAPEHPELPKVIPAVPEDWDAEYDDYILAVRIVNSTEEAVDFINEHGTGHSEAIITKNYMTSQYFLDAVDAAAVYVNASTRFTDGGEFGLGAEIGISTQKMHARGPMGLNEMTSYKYIIYGEGQTR